VTAAEGIAAPQAGAAFGVRWDALQKREPLIEARDLGISFDLRFDRSRTVRVGLRSIFRRTRHQILWAVRHLTLRVHAGECLAVVGANGAGKSTLLQTFAGILTQDEGSLVRNGAVSALLNLGVGFDPKLTGRENVELVAALLGLSARRTRERLPDVFEFADVGDFFDAPLRTYSSGMRARLGFAVATMIEPQILVLDEVIGTGDAAFRIKSRERLSELVRSAHAVVLATHDMQWVADFANYAILMDHGQVIAEGAPEAVVALHRARSGRPPRQYDCPGCATAPAGGYCELCGIRFNAQG